MMAAQFLRVPPIFLCRRCLQITLPFARTTKSQCRSSNLLSTGSIEGQNLRNFSSSTLIRTINIPSNATEYSRRCFSSSSRLKPEDLTMSTPVLVKYLESLAYQCDEAEATLINSQSAEERTNAHRMQLQLKPLVLAYRQFKQKKEEKRELHQMVEDTDSEMASMAKQELEPIHTALEQLEAEILEQLVPLEPADDNDVVLEVTAGVGGQEAMLFTEQIFTMYTNFANTQGWAFDIIQYDPNEIGGIRYGSAIVRGQGVHQVMKFEGGVHRVQRIPKTEKAGRIHTSTTSVSVMPKPTEVDVVVSKADIKVDVFKASGAGGQHVNKTESAVRLTHLPTGVVAECQMNRSQIKNREIALEILRTKLFEKEMQAQQSKFNSERKIQVGSGARSDKIRTYNFKEDRISDHRLGSNRFDLEEFLSGGEGLEELLEALLQASQAEQLIGILEQFEKNNKDNL